MADPLSERTAIMANRMQAKGRVREMRGKVDAAVGDVTGDTGAKLRGRAREAAGVAERVAGDAKKKATRAARDARSRTERKRRSG
jgi:uncharacterized protein YjbJ (UPF0337 family)